MVTEMVAAVPEVLILLVRPIMGAVTAAVTVRVAAELVAEPALLVTTTV
jgi:hypothetical protein